MGDQPTGNPSEDTSGAWSDGMGFGSRLWRNARLLGDVVLDKGLNAVGIGDGSTPDVAAAVADDYQAKADQLRAQGDEAGAEAAEEAAANALGNSTNTQGDAMIDTAAENTKKQIAADPLDAFFGKYKWWLIGAGVLLGLAAVGPYVAPLLVARKAA